MQIVKIAATLLLVQVARAGGVIHLKSRDIVAATPSTPISMIGSSAGNKEHFLVLFGSYPGPEVLAILASRRVSVLSYVPENGLTVSATKLNLRGLDVQWAGPMDPADKISPMVMDRPWGSYLVIWHADTDSARDSALAQNLGFTVVPNANLLSGQSLVSGAHSALSSLAALDQVAYILPASAELQNGDAITGCAGARTPIGPVAQYVKADGGWKRDGSGQVAIGYYFESLTPKVPESQIRGEVARAFAEWAQYANISVSPVVQPGLDRTIDILFARYAHGDAYPFNGPGGVLAHTFYPAPNNPEPLAGDMHLNADESWSVGSTVDLFSVALHEAGHALGLGHSDDPTSVMYPYYRQQTGLTADDIAGIQALYGQPVSSASPASPIGGSGKSPDTPPVTGGGTGSSNSAPDVVAPTITITSPGSSITSIASPAISLSGKASDNVGVGSVQWSTSNGGSGTASGTNAWSAVVPLLVGNNTVTVRAYDAAGNSSWRAITVVRIQ